MVSNGNYMIQIIGSIGLSAPQTANCGLIFGKQIAKKQSRLMKGTIPLQQEAMDELLPELTSLVMEEVQASF